MSDPGEAGKYRIENQQPVWGQVIGDYTTVHIYHTPPLDASALPNLPERIWNIPYPRNLFFTGRDELLKQVAARLRGGETTALSQPQAISGLGGVGKTQLVVEYAYQHRSDYQAVLWARAESQEALTSSCVAIAALLNLPQKEEQVQALIVQAVRAWLQTHTSWLLILDNADDLTVVRDFLPPAFQGHVLLTTRAQAMGRLAHKIEVETLSPEVGALFLLQRAGIIPPEASLDAAQAADCKYALQITQELDGLPLALDQAGAYLEETGCSLADYQQLYQQHRRELLQERRGQVADHPESVATTWALSFARVEQANPAAADLLRLCALLAPDAIPEEILSADMEHRGPDSSSVAIDAFLLNQFIEALRAYSLVKRDAATRTFSIHRLVQAVIIDDMSPAILRASIERTIHCLAAGLPETLEVTFANWTKWERLLPHALICAAYLQQTHVISSEAAELLRLIGWYLGERGQLFQATSLLRQALALYQEIQGSELSTATSLVTLGWLYRAQAMYLEAEPLYQRALAIREQTLAGCWATRVACASRLRNPPRGSLKHAP